MPVALALGRMFVRCCAVAGVFWVGVVGCAGDSESSHDYPEEWYYLENQLLTHEEMIAKCMKEAGFDYIAALPGSAYYEREAILADFEGTEVDLDSVVVPKNPNDDIVASYDPVTRQAYLVAYWGDETGASDEGCLYSTQVEAWGTIPEEPFDMDELNALVASDPRTLQAEAVFEACVEAHGYEGVNMDDFEDSFHEYRDSLPEGTDDSPEARAWVDGYYEASDDCVPALGDVLTEVEAEMIELLHDS